MTNIMTTSVYQMAIPIFGAPSREHVGLDGQILFGNFIQEELEHEGLTVSIPMGAGDSLLNEPIANGVYAEGFEESVSASITNTVEGYNNAHIVQIAVNVRDLADKFAASHERELVRQQAEQMDTTALSKDAFFKFLEVIFKNGINKYCLIALFYFCSDILIRCLRQNMFNLGRQLFTWSRQFVLERVCAWVYENGGWERVLSNVWEIFMKAAALGLLFVGIGCGVVYIKKNW